MWRRPKPTRSTNIWLCALFLAIASPPSPQAQTPPTPAAPTAPKDDAAETGVEGFRSARFGMTEAQLRAAIKSDFKVADNAIKAATHPVEQTRVLQVGVRDLVAIGGEAQIHYVLGFRSKTLIQINVLWSASDAAGVETMVAVAGALRDLFVSQGQSGRFKKESIVVNARSPDGTVVVFRGADEQNRTVQLLFASAQGAPPAQGKPSQVGAQVRLMYILSPDKPDIQRPKSGQF
jgi:hypothetical protein